MLARLVLAAATAAFLTSGPSFAQVASTPPAQSTQPHQAQMDKLEAAVSPDPEMKPKKTQRSAHAAQELRCCAIYKRTTGSTKPCTFFSNYCEILRMPGFVEKFGRLW